MWIEEKLREIISRAANDFDRIVEQERKIASSEDGTSRGQQLDQILVDQKNEREALWKRLHELEDIHAAKGLKKLYIEKEEKEQVKINTLKAEQDEILKQVNQQMIESRNVERETNETLIELQFKEKLNKTVNELQEALKSIDQELSEATDTLERERTVLKECQQITEVLQQKLEEAEQPEAIQQATMEVHDTVNRLKEKHKIIMDELIDFLHEYYPPHTVDDIDGDDDDQKETCELIFILEDLMNLAVLKQHDPYLQLISGTYWSPYIEVLIKARIAVRDPQNPSRIRLVDFRV
ncbi:centromere protein Cenp-K [Circinella umbellata]|nr:centromere protein Cenp-K [Circinella umbellata]